MTCPLMLGLIIAWRPKIGPHAKALLTCVWLVGGGCCWCFTPAALASHNCYLLVKAFASHAICVAMGVYVFVKLVNNLYKTHPCGHTILDEQTCYITSKTRL